VPRKNFPVENSNGCGVCAALRDGERWRVDGRRLATDGDGGTKDEGEMGGNGLYVVYRI
jgi:hypothetical protein